MGITMIRRRTRVLWALTGAFLLLGATVSVLIWLRPNTVSAHLRELGAIFDVIALLLWMLVFAVSMTWSSKDTSSPNDKT
jgi:hypothetical protein